MDPLALRVAARFQRLADQAAGQRQRARNLAQPLNKPKGIDREIVRDFAQTKTEGEETVEPDRRDIQPKDVFSPTPNHTGVLNLAETGKDLDRVIRKQVPKDKGSDTVRNLSQYLIRTEGGGEGEPEGRKKA